jgi:hypothetical protein
VPAQIYTFDDMAFVTQSLKISYTELLHTLFFTSDRILTHSCLDCIPSRPGILLLLKTLYLPLGFNINLTYFFRALVVTGICSFIFYFLALSTKKKVIALMGSIFYVTLPPVFSSTWLWGDVELFAEFFALTALFFLCMLIQVSEDTSARYIKIRRIIYIILFTFFLIFAVRTKETTKIFIIIFPLVTVLFYRKLFLWLLPSFLLILYYIFPTTSGGYGTPFSFTSFYDKVIASAGAEYSPEIPSIFSPSQHFTQVPSSLLNQLGFFLGYFVIVTLLSFLVRKIRLSTIKELLSKIKASKMEKDKLIFYISLFWMSLTFVAYGFFSSVGHRYYAVGLIPFTLLIFLLVAHVGDSISNNTFKKVYYSCFVIFLLITITTNVFHISYHMRGGTIGYHKANFDTIKYLLSSENNITYNNEDVAYLLFYWIFDNEKYYQSIKNDTINRTFYNGVNYIGLRYIGDFNQSTFGNETAYFVNRWANTTPHELNQSQYNVTYLTAFGGCFDTSAYCLVKNIFIKPKKTHFVYAVNRVN